MASTVQKKVAVFATCLSLAAAGGAHAQSPQVYILAGQSNMSGRGLLEELRPEERTAVEQIQVYGNDGKLHVASEPLDDATNQVDPVSADTQAAVGPGLFFARAIHAAEPRPIILLPCAKGGSSIGRWAPGRGRDTLYGSCLARARELGAPVAGILWYQGESDAEKPDAALSWKSAFDGLVAAFRRDLQAPRLPVVFVQLADPPPASDGARAYPSWTQIQSLQAAPAAECVSMTSAGGLALKPDGLHLNTDAQRILGARLATAMIRLRQQGCGQ